LHQPGSASIPQLKPAMHCFHPTPMIDSVSSTTVPAFQTATFSAHLTASGVKPRRHTTCSSTDDVSRCDVICDLPQNFVVSCEQLVDVGVIGHWLTQSTLFKGAAQRITVNSTPAADDSDSFSDFSLSNRDRKLAGYKCVSDSTPAGSTLT